MPLIFPSSRILAYAVVLCIGLLLAIVPTQPSNALVKGSSKKTSKAKESPLIDQNLIEALRYEIQNLRGQVEKLAFQFEQLKKQRINDYLDLDKRLSNLSRRALTTEVPPTTTFMPTEEEAKALVAGLDTPQSTQEEDSFTDVSSLYSNAFNNLKDKKTDIAIATFESIVNGHPNTEEAAMSMYWLGRIYILQKNKEQARQYFIQFIDNFNSHRKVFEVAYSLGKIYQNLKDSKMALHYLEMALKGNNQLILDRVKQFVKTYYPNSELATSIQDRPLQNLQISIPPIALRSAPQKE